MLTFNNHVAYSPMPLPDSIGVTIGGLSPPGTVSSFLVVPQHLHIPNVAIAVSGGGCRAMTSGAGALKGLRQSHRQFPPPKGQLGGLQSATYVSGLSGGSWLLGSIVVNNFTTVGALQADEKATGNISSKRWTLRKKPATTPPSLTTGVVPPTSSSTPPPTTVASTTWSSIALTDTFKRGQMPLPLVVADGRNLAKGHRHQLHRLRVQPLGIRHLGSLRLRLLRHWNSSALDSRGSKLADDEKCVRGFDNAGFVMGTSSSLFNQGLLRLNKTDAPTSSKDTMYKLLKHGPKRRGYRRLLPNPFYRYRNATHLRPAARSRCCRRRRRRSEHPSLHPVIRPSRHVDVVFAVDSSADTNSWPNGCLTRPHLRT
ncbi:Lysophospholipase 1 [Aspergillus tanneri]|uniref:Lysophospholipase n=1 Tax=Aspergillus tanneri TaxID=1220188 RepID=A0A5M9M815_9EURO|nr:Lysophospholipase 1 [Aspergillus tanneri]KAA8641484.1 Lysophospholipase 1 [Aspergillus tanneri]